MAAWLAVNALALVAPMIDTLRPSKVFEFPIRQIRPALARLLHPLAAVKRAALGGAAVFRICRVRATG